MGVPSLAHRRICVLTASAATLLVSSPGPAQESGHVAGTVSDSTTGMPLANVLVTLATPDGKGVGSALSGPSGTFRLGGIPPGEYEAQASLPGWEPLPQPNLIVLAGSSTRFVISMVQRPYRLNPLTVSASRAGEKVLDAPAAVAGVGLDEIREQPALTTVDHVRNETAVDFMQTGLQGSYVVVRGFNNVFSGATLTLTDNRIARLPSLRANIAYFNPITSLDLDRAEVVLGPASALYGPNVEQGIIQTFTRSPIDDPGISVSVASGIRQQPAVSEQGLDSSREGVAHFEGRVAYRASDAIGFKVSGQYFAAMDYLYGDPSEQEQQQSAQACLSGGLQVTDPNCQNFADGLDPTDPSDRVELESRVRNVAGGRDNDLRRWTLDARVDWRPGPGTSLVFAGGRAMAVNSVDLTGLGAGQIVDWAYDYAQARFQWRDLFAQAYVNRSVNDDSYLLRSGKTLIDHSRLFVAQLQHVSRIGDQHRLVYGLDFLRTAPVTDSTINGRNEEDDDVNELGGYLQWESSLNRQLDMVLAARVDRNSRLSEPVFSPRAALVYRPAPEHSVRLTFNRAFSTPNTISLFLDISGGTANILGPFRYDVRAQGGSDTGFTFRRDGRVPRHLSPFAPLFGSTPRDYLPSSAPMLWIEGVALTQALAAEGVIDPDIARILAELPPPDDSQVSVLALVADPNATEDEPGYVEVSGGLEGIQDLPPLEAGITNTLELGYKGLLGEKLLVSGSGWYSHVSDRISALRVISPNVFLDGSSLNSYLADEFLARVGTDFPDEGTALAAAAAVSGTLAQIPLGVVAPEQAGGTLAPIVMTDRNLGSFDPWGVDVSLAWHMTERWSLEGIASWVSDDRFTVREGPGAEVVPLNAPSLKGSLAIRYGDPSGRLHGTVRARAVRGFPANSGVFAGQVEDYGAVDLSVGYRFSRTGLWLQLGVQNLLNTGFSTFPGSATLGRTSLLRLRYDTPSF
jgi:outer membrane receptor for ferrienterochelin and colicins